MRSEEPLVTPVVMGKGAGVNSIVAITGRDVGSDATKLRRLRRMWDPCVHRIRIVYVVNRKNDLQRMT